MKKLIWAVVAIAIIGGGYYWYSQKSGAAPASQQGTTGKVDGSDISWKFEDAGERDSIPYTKVSVTMSGKTQVVGEYQGSCAEVGASGGVDGKGLLAGELSAAQCWYAGGGDEIGVFAVEDGSYELMVGQLSEPQEGSEGFRGNFQIQTDIKL